MTDIGMILRHHCHRFFTAGPDNLIAAIDSFPDLSQCGDLVHGCHGLFYWQRALGDGYLLAHKGAGVVASLRSDVGQFTLIRPFGMMTDIVQLLNNIAKELKTVISYPIVVRYSGAQLTDALLESRQWRHSMQKWYSTAPYDDETFPEVVLTGPFIDIPIGPASRPVRVACRHHAIDYRCEAHRAILRCSEEGFVRRHLPESVGIDRLGDFDGFVAATFSAIELFGDLMHLNYHYIFDNRSDGLNGFAITGVRDAKCYGYFLSVSNVKHLSTYFLWQVALHEFRQNRIFSFNLGGSEVKNLYEFKTEHFGSSHNIVTRTLEFVGA